MNPSRGCVVGVDPGRAKAGYALLSRSGEAIAAGIAALDDLPERLAELIAGHEVEVIALGRGTNAKQVAAGLDALGLAVALVDEFETTRRARELYFAEHPPRGWRRLIPIGLQTPKRPVDDYAAILIARRWLAGR